MADQKEGEQELISLDEAAKRLGFTKMYVRALVRRRQLGTVQVPLGPESQVWKHMLKASDVEAMKVHKVRTGKATKGDTHNRRGDGRKKFAIYCTPEEADAIRNYLQTQGFTEALGSFVALTQTGVYKARKQKMIEKLRKEVQSK